MDKKGSHSESESAEEERESYMDQDTETEERDIYSEFSQLFQECDDVTNTFYQCEQSGSELDKTVKGKGLGNETSSSNSRNINSIPSENSLNTNSKQMNHINENLNELKKDQIKSSNYSNCCDSTISAKNTLSSNMTSESRDSSKTSIKRGWKVPEGNKTEAEIPLTKTVHVLPLPLESSREEGELTPTVIEHDDMSEETDTEIEEKQVKTMRKVEHPSSFIDTSKEEGECSTTSFEDLDTTVINVHNETSPKTLIEFVPSKKENNTLKGKRKKAGLRHTFMTSLFNKRKRSLEEMNENTPKRHKIFDVEGVLSPISCDKDEQFRNPEFAETPQIDSKFKFSDNDVNCSTPVARVLENKDSCKSETNTCKNELAKKFAVDNTCDSESDADSQFSGFSEQDEEKTLDELISEISQLIEEDSVTEELEGSEVKERNHVKQSLSKIDVEEFFSKPESVIEISSYVDSESKTKTSGQNDSVIENKFSAVENDETFKEIDKTLTDDNIKISEKENDSSKAVGKSKPGRFEEWVTLDRIEVGGENKTILEPVDMECEINEDDLLNGGDLLNLDDYDDEDGFIDEKDLEKSHLTKDLNLTIQSKAIITTQLSETDGASTALKKTDIEESKTKTVKSKEIVADVAEPAEPTSKQTMANKELKKDDVKRNVFKFTEYDDSIYRRQVSSDFEYEVCQKWGTKGTPDPDINLTVSATYRKKCNVTDLKTCLGFLEGEKVVCTHLYEDEIQSKFENYGLTDGQSKLCCMSVEVVLERLNNQKALIENLHKSNLMVLQREAKSQLHQMIVKHTQEEFCLRARQQMEFDSFRFGTIGIYNGIQMAHCLTILRQEHNMQMNRMKIHQRQQINDFNNERRKMLDHVISDLQKQRSPIDELIAQLQSPENLTSTSPKKYGPPIMVSLRKGPCKASNWKHSTVTVCLSAGIAQAVSLEDDLYDHYYGY